MKKVESTNDTKLIVFEDGDKAPSLDELKEYVKRGATGCASAGWIEIVTIQRDSKFAKIGDQLIVNEMGHVEGLPINQKATDIYWSTCISGTVSFIVGDCVHLTGSARLT